MILIDEWTRQLPDRRTVRYVYKKVSEDVASLEMKVEGKPGSELLNVPNIQHPLTREQVESKFDIK